MSQHPPASAPLVTSPSDGRVASSLLLCARAGRGWLPLALLLAVLAAAAPSAAESPTSDTASAAALVEQGVELRRNSRDEEALALFRRAVDLDPGSPRARAHLGTTYQALGRWVLAEVHLAQALE